MIKCFFSVFLLLPLFSFAHLITPFERSDSAETATYFETIAFYKDLCRQHPNQLKMDEAGPSDVDYPLNVIYYSSNGSFDPISWKQQDKFILLINNGIHPGEPDGIDASMLLLRDAAEGKLKIPDNIILAVIPVFNIGGALNRNSYSRVNQDGPKAYGFRGNAQNLDLNRDFIKLDAKETQSLIQLFHRLDPDIFIDNHVSDGADYQYVMTLLATQHNKLGGATGKYMNDVFVPLIYKDMKKRGYELVPYVNDFKTTPDHGWTEFYDPPRFSSGFAALFQTMAFVPETHMLKPFKQRVAATYALMNSFIKIAAQHANDIKDIRKKDREAISRKQYLTIDWKADTTYATYIPFKGYEPGYKPSQVSGMPRLYYDRTKPFTREVPFYNHFITSQKVLVPKAYVISQGWDKVIQRLKWNGVIMQPVDRDTTIEVTAYLVDKYETAPRPYESHYLHHNVIYHPAKQKIRLLKGDYIIPTDQPAKRYLVETLEPNAPDAFFVWNFFDGILQEKEYYSDYVFEDLAVALLARDTTLQNMLEEKKKEDPPFAKDGTAQLDFVYRHSPYMEPEYMRYPVFRIEQ